MTQVLTQNSREGLRKITENFIQKSLFVVRDSNMGHLE
jgi:hypothetical protein